MSVLTLALAAVSLGFAASVEPLPDIVKGLPPTWPPPGWSTGLSVPGQPVQQPATRQPVEADKWVDAFPHVRVNRGLKAVEFDGVVAWDFHDADAPRTELELLVCLPMRDKEHESLVLSQAKGAHVHAALLMAGLEPGTPGKFDFGEEQAPAIKRVPPTGPLVTVSFHYLKDGKECVDFPSSWFVDEVEKKEFEERLELRRQQGAQGDRRDVNLLGAPPLRLVFAGSKVGQMRNEQGDKVNVYNADELGCLIGLCTFGNETIANSRVVSPDSGVDAPRFVAKNAAIPPRDTAVRVRISGEEEEEKAFPGLQDSLRSGQ